MRKLSVLGAAAVLASAAALPSMVHAAGCAQYDPTCETYKLPKNDTAANPSNPANARAEASSAETSRAQTSSRVENSRAQTRMGSARTTSTQRHERYRSASRTGRMERREAMNDRRYRSGYDETGQYYRPGPGEVVGGAVGTAGAVAAGAVNTAGAIATAPFRTADSYAYYDNGYNGGWHQQSYAERNGFVCTPGTSFKGFDGKMHPCQ
jgi:hypothetical protein